MHSVKVNKDDLVEILKSNMITHQADFDLAWEGFRRKALQNAESIINSLKNAKKGGQVNLHVNLVPPQDHTDDYKTAIEMCEWEVDDEVSLTQSEFQQFVQDDWNWKGNFTASNMMYTGEESPSKK